MKEYITDEDMKWMDRAARDVIIALAQTDDNFDYEFRNTKMLEIYKETIATAIHGAYLEYKVSKDNE